MSTWPGNSGRTSTVVNPTISTRLKIARFQAGAIFPSARRGGGSAGDRPFAVAGLDGLAVGLGGGDAVVRSATEVCLIQTSDVRRQKPEIRPRSRFDDAPPGAGGCTARGRP